MTISPAQLELRKKHLGASDIPAILGLNPYRTPADVWLIKTGQVDDAAIESQAIEDGNDFEAVGVKRLAKRVGLTALPDPPTARAKNGVMIAHPDCLLAPFSPSRVEQFTDHTEVSGCFPGEIKWRGDIFDWGDAGTDQIPVDVLSQMYGHHICMGGVPEGYAGVGSPKWRGWEFRHYVVAFKTDTAAEIEDRCLGWWDQHVRKGIMPDVSTGAPSLELVKRIARRPSVWADIKRETASRFVHAKACAKAAEKEVETAQALLLAEMAGADGARTEDYEFTNSEIVKKAEAMPRAGYTYRQLRVKAVSA